MAVLTDCDEFVLARICDIGKSRFFIDSQVIVVDFSANSEVLDEIE